MTAQSGPAKGRHSGNKKLNRAVSPEVTTLFLCNGFVEINGMSVSGHKELDC